MSERIRNAALEEAALIAEKWRDENRKACAAARARSAHSEAAANMVDMLDGAAIECNAIAGAIRELKRPERAWREPSLEVRPY